MNHRILFVIFPFFVYFIISISSASAEVRACYDCANCSAELKDNVYLVLNNSFFNESDCIKDIDGTPNYNVTIDCNGHDITDTTSAPNYGIRLYYYSNITVKNCSIHGFHEGLYLKETQGASNKIDNVTISGAQYFGIDIRDSNNITITNATITNSGWGGEYAGIYIYKSNYTNVTRSTMEANKYGIYIYDNSYNNLVTENIITNNNKTGICLGITPSYKSPDNNTIFDNRIRNNSVTESLKFEIEIESGAKYNNISYNGFKHMINNSETTTIAEGNIYSDLIVGTAPLFIVDYPTIGAAIAGASANDLIHVMSGIYPECVKVDKPVSLQGADKENTNISCAQSKSAVEISSGADGAQISNFTISTTSQYHYALYATGVSNIMIKENTILGNEGLKLSYVGNSTVYKNLVNGVLGSAESWCATHNNFSYNLFHNKFSLGYNSASNSLWMNNFTNEGDDYIPDDNDYCVFGLDNSYNALREGESGLSCAEDFLNYFNDSAVYQNETVLFSVDTSPGESNYTQINATINGTNCTLALTGGDSIDGLWTCEFNETGELGTYTATALYYLEADGDKGSAGVKVTTSFLHSILCVSHSHFRE